MSQTYPFVLTVTGDDEAQDIAVPILEQAARDIRSALRDVNVWAEVEVAGDGTADTY